jgi:hypothetical protein
MPETVILLHSVQIDSVTHTSPCLLGTGLLALGVK